MFYLEESLIQDEMEMPKPPTTSRRGRRRLVCYAVKHCKACVGRVTQFLTPTTIPSLLKNLIALSSSFVLCANFLLAFQIFQFTTTINLSFNISSFWLLYVMEKPKAEFISSWDQNLRLPGQHTSSELTCNSRSCGLDSTLSPEKSNCIILSIFLCLS